MVRKRGLEPLWVSPPDPKSGASANSATFAHRKSLRVAELRYAHNLRAFVLGRCSTFCSTPRVQGCNTLRKCSTPTYLGRGQQSLQQVERALDVPRRGVDVPLRDGHAAVSGDTHDLPLVRASLTHAGQQGVPERVDVELGRQSVLVAEVPVTFADRVLRQRSHPHPSCRTLASTKPARGVTTPSPNWATGFTCS
jgi:hypothetical protein